MEVFEALWPFTMYEYQLNECASTIQGNTGVTGLVGEPQLELMAIVRVRIECHRLCYVINRQSHVFGCN